MSDKKYNIRVNGKVRDTRSSSSSATARAAVLQNGAPSSRIKIETVVVEEKKRGRVYKLPQKIQYKVIGGRVIVKGA